MPADPAGLLELWTLAVRGGRLPPEARRWLQDLAVTAAAVPLRDALLAAGEPNPELAAVAGVDAGFEARLLALQTHARPGDLLFWRSHERGWPWWLLRELYGPWMHVSLVLADGRLLDPYWPEGADIVTLEAAVAKNARRIRAREVLVARPRAPLSEAVVARLTAAAEALHGRPYTLIAPPERPSEGASCTRHIWELLQAEGVDLAAGRRRLLRSGLSPRDIMPEPVAWVGEGGEVSMTEFPNPDPELGLCGPVVRWAENAFGGLPPVAAWLASVSEPLTATFMGWMAPGPLRWSGDERG